MNIRVPGRCNRSCGAVHLLCLNWSGFLGKGTAYRGAWYALQLNRGMAIAVGLSSGVCNYSYCFWFTGHLGCIIANLQNIAEIVVFAFS